MRRHLRSNAVDTSCMILQWPVRVQQAVASQVGSSSLCLGANITVDKAAACCYYLQQEAVQTDVSL